MQKVSRIVNGDTILKCSPSFLALKKMLIKIVVNVDVHVFLCVITLHSFLKREYVLLTNI